MDNLELRRGTDEEKESQLRRLKAFREEHSAECGPALERLQNTALSGENVFAELMHAVRHCSLGQITQALFAVG